MKFNGNRVRCWWWWRWCGCCRILKHLMPPFSRLSLSENFPSNTFMVHLALFGKLNRESWKLSIISQTNHNWLKLKCYAFVLSPGNQQLRCKSKIFHSNQMPKINFNYFVCPKKCPPLNNTNKSSHLIFRWTSNFSNLFFKQIIICYSCNIMQSQIIYFIF